MAWEKGFLTTHPGAPLPTNDTIQALHQKAKENYDKARAAWEEGVRKALGSKKVDMDKKKRSSGHNNNNVSNDG